jgi:hypothetical protein
VTVMELFAKLVFYVCGGVVLAGAVIWYVSSAYEEITGHSALVIAPFTIADNADEKNKGRSEALAKMLHAHLQQIEHDLNVSQQNLVTGSRPDVPTASAGERAQVATEKLTSIVPPLFATQGVSLQTRLLEPTQIKIAVGGVDVGGVLPWFQRLLVTQRTLDFTYYETPTMVKVSGALHPMGLSNEALRVEVPKENGKSADLDQVALMVAVEIERLRLARDPSNRVEALNLSEFSELIAALNETVQLNRQVAMGRPARERFAALLARLEPLAGEVRDWYQLQLLVAGTAVSANRPDRAVVYFRGAHDAMQAQLQTANAGAQSELRERIAAVKASIDGLQPIAAKLTAVEGEEALLRIKQETVRATDALNKLFHINRKPLPVQLLPADKANAYTDGKEYYAPAAVAQLPEITWHNASWPYINQFIPVFSGDAGGEGLVVAHSYADVLPMLIRQIELIDSSDSHSWDLYSGYVAWIKAVLQNREFKLGADRRPLRSFANPGTAFNDPVVGKDPQIAQYRDLTPQTDPHSGAGIGNKAFYEAAQRVGVARAGEVWLAALTCVSKNGPVTYRRLGECLLEAAGDNRSKINEALRAVGLGQPGG